MEFSDKIGTNELMGVLRKLRNVYYQYSSLETIGTSLLHMNFSQPINIIYSTSEYRKFLKNNEQTVIQSTTSLSQSSPVVVSFRGNTFRRIPTKSGQETTEECERNLCSLPLGTNWWKIPQSHVRKYLTYNFIVANFP